MKVFESNDKVVLPPWDPMVSCPANLLRHPSLITRRVRLPNVVPRGSWTEMCYAASSPQIAKMCRPRMCQFEYPDVVYRDLC